MAQAARFCSRKAASSGVSPEAEADAVAEVEVKAEVGGGQSAPVAGACCPDRLGTLLRGLKKAEAAITVGGEGEGRRRQEMEKRGSNGGNLERNAGRSRQRERGNCVEKGTGVTPGRKWREKKKERREGTRRKSVANGAKMAWLVLSLSLYSL